MPQEPHNPYPFPTAADANSAPGDKQTKAVRNVVSRHITGLSKRMFIMGETDGSVVFNGVLDLVNVCYDLLDSIDQADALKEGPTGQAILDRALAVREILADHRCPETTEN